MELKTRIEENLRYALSAIQAMIGEGNTDRINDYLSLFGDMLPFYRKYWNLDLDWAYAELVKILREPADLMLAAAMDAEYRSLGEAAVKFAKAAATLHHGLHYKIFSAASSRKTGKITEAREICREVDQFYPGHQAVMSELFMCDVSEHFWSLDYYDLFAEIHRTYQPRVYLEIGVATGKSLALARLGARALGIDPASAEQAFLSFNSPENDPQLYKMTSDDFFSNMDVTKEMGGPHFDVAFIDGLHHFDQVLRDFINLEKLAGPGSIILIHDCLPINARVAARDRSTWFWTGDVWKVIPCLLAVRPDLEIVTLPVSPSGIALVRRLDPSSRILERQYESLVQHFATLELPDDWGDRCNLLNVHMDQAAFKLDEYLPPKGWL